MEGKELEVVRPAEVGREVRAEDFMPLMTVQQAVQRKQQINQMIGGVLNEGEDYGFMPGDSRKEKKKVLLKPGAEKLCSIFGLAPRYVKETVIEDWTGKDHGEPLFYYEYRCQLYRGDRFMGEAIGSANSWEQKHRYRWVKEADVPDTYTQEDLDSRLPKRTTTITEFQFAINKRETSGPYGKPASYWQEWLDAINSGEAKAIQKTTSKGKDMDAWERGGTLYRVPNPDCADLVNTLQKMAQKRAQVAAVLVVTNCSDAFTQDIEDADPGAGVDSIDTGGHPVGTQAAADHVAKTKIENGKKSEVAEPPKDLRVLLDGIEKNPTSFRAAYELLSRQMSDKAGSNGAKAYDKWAAEISEKFPQGTTNKAALKFAITDLYKIYQEVQMPEPEAPKQSAFDEHMEEAKK